MQNKPKEIVELEKLLGIEITELENGSLAYLSRNYFYCNNNKEIIILNLIENNISDISFIKSFPFLERLFLSKNKITEINVLYFLQNLNYLQIFDNQIRDISVFKNLTEIKFLDISSNPIKDFSNIGHFVDLQYLNISFTKCSDLLFIKKLKNLHTLNATYLNISDISALKNLTKLEELRLGFNLLDDNQISVLTYLKELHTIDLSKNKISDISVLKELKELTTLELSNNKISDISYIIYLNKIEQIDFQYNDVFDITDLLKIESLKIVNLTGNKKVEIDYPKEVLDAGWEAIKQFSEKSKEKVPFKNVKVLLLGNPNIGKSNLLEFLETNAIPSKNDSTHGVIYKSVVLNEINFHVWDFGGQEYFHATHKLFFSSNALNIILWGKNIERENEVENEFFDLNYWLRTVEQLNNHSENEEVIIIENKIDLNFPAYQETNLNQKEITDKYKTLNSTFSNFSLINLKRTDIFKSIFIEKAESIISRFNYPAFYEVFWKRIQEKNKDFVTVEEINNRPHKENVIAALKVFHNMGMLLYFHDLTPDKVFCKPQVLLDLLYEKVLSKDKKDRLTKQEIENSIVSNLLELNIEDVIKLLKHFDLVFQIAEEKDVFFIPQYLKQINPYISNLKDQIFKGCNIKIFGDNYLMSSAMLKIFSKYGNYVSKEENDYWFWRNGLIIKKDDCILMIEFNRKKQLIELYLDKEFKNLELQKEIVDFILDLPEDINLPKRNFDNHKKKRWRDVQNPDDVDHSPNFSERIQNHDGYLEYFEHKNWNNDYLWCSNFFTVSVSVDFEYFIDWETLKQNENLYEINFKKENGDLKKVNINEYCYFINKESQIKKENKKM